MAKHTSRQPATFLAFGDSITELAFAPNGWANLLAQRYVRRADVVNRGFSGYNTRWALCIADDVLDVLRRAHRPQVVVLFFGANDASLADANMRQHVPLDEYRANLDSLIAAARKAAPEALIAVLGPPPVHAEQRLAFQRAKYGDRATGVLERTLASAQRYSAAASEAAAAAGVAWLDVCELFLRQGADAWPRLLTDGVHLSDAGNAVLSEALCQMLSSAGLGPEDLAVCFPGHADVDAERPDACFAAVR